MATPKHTTSPRLSNDLVLAYDAQGRETFLFVVDHPSGMVTIADHQTVRSMHPRDAARLVLALVAAMSKSH